MMVEVEPSKVLEVLKILVSPVNLNQDDTGGKVFDDFLHTNVLELCRQLETKYKDVRDQLDVSSHPSDDGDVRWDFVLWNLRLLSVLRFSLETAVGRQERGEGDVSSPSADLLSLAQQKTVLTSVQLVVCLGICPGLLPGVGVPVECRSQYGRLLLPRDCAGVSREERHQRLLLCLRELLNCIRLVSLRSLILPRHLSDLLAALCQLCYGPKTAPVRSPQSFDSRASVAGESTGSGSVQTQNQHVLFCKPEASQQVSTESNTTQQCQNSRSSPGEHSVQGASTERLVGDVVLPPVSGHERAKEVFFPGEEELGPVRCKEELQRLLDEAPKPLLMRDLLLLQGGPRRTTAKNARCPEWLQKVGGRLLADQLTQSGGIQHLLSTMLQGQSDSADWRKCNAIAQIITRCPHQMMSDEYYRQVAPQLNELLHMSEHQVSPLYIRVAVATIVAMTTQNKEAAQRLIITPLLNPLLKCTEGKQGDCQPVACEELSQCLLDIHKVFVVGSEPHSPLLDVLQPVLHVLFRLYCFIKSGVSHLRQPVQDILVTFLRQTDHQVALVVLQLMAFGDIHDRPADVTCVRMSDRLHFALTATGGVVTTTKCASLTQSVFDRGQWEETCQCIVHLLKQLNLDRLTAEFFLLLLKELTTIVSEEVSEGIQLTPGGRGSGRRLGRNLQVLDLLAALSEHVDPACFSSNQHILQLAQVTMERGVKVLEHTSDETLCVFETDTLTLAMGLLTAVLSQPHKLTTADRDQSKSLLPLLQHIATDHSDPNIQEMATDLRIAIATHGIVLSELAKQRATDMKETGHVGKGKVQSEVIGAKSVRSEVKRSAGHGSAPLIEVLSSCDSGDSEATSAVKCVTRNDTTEGRDKIHGMSPSFTGDKVSGGGDTMSSSNTMSTGVTSTSVTTSTCDTKSADVTSNSDASPLDQALSELCDSLVPVRGHALITLTNLLQRRDPATLTRSDMLLKVFRENLDHPDTYLYLQAVSGLAALGDCAPDTILPTLLQEYSQASRSVELRVKMGEVIVKICRRLGDMIPPYRDALLGVLLGVARDTEPLVRASCLSNLGDVCKLLRFSLGTVIHEVFEVTSQLLKTDPSPEVRKAAALFLTLLLQGMDIDTIQVLDTVLRDLYRLLKLVMVTECEEMVKVHVQLALEELDTISRRLLFPPQTLTKRISILHP